MIQTVSHLPFVDRSAEGWPAKREKLTKLSQFWAEVVDATSFHFHSNEEHGDRCNSGE
jgi:hypothetical protein